MRFRTLSINSREARQDLQDRQDKGKNPNDPVNMLDLWQI